MTLKPNQINNCVDVICLLQQPESRRGTYNIEHMKALDVQLFSLCSKVDDVNSFDWQKQLRYYWDPEIDNCVVRMSNSLYIYGYEYLGASARLVITPLTVSTKSSSRLILATNLSSHQSTADFIQNFRVGH